MKQDQYVASYECEHHANMNSGSHAMIADVAKLNHRDVVKHRDLSGRTEIRSEAIARPNVNKNFSILPKSHYDPMPNNFGEPVHHELRKKAGAKGMHKGGNRYA